MEKTMTFWDVGVHMQGCSGPTGAESIFNPNMSNPLPDNMASHQVNHEWS
jgi:hypothetical protein